MTETLTLPIRKKLTALARQAVADRVATDRIAAGHIRSYLRLIHSFLGSKKIMGYLSGNPVTNKDPVSYQVRCIENDLLSEARLAYMNQPKRKRVVVVNGPDREPEDLGAAEFDRLPYLDRVKCVNRVYRKRIEEIEGSLDSGKMSDESLPFAVEDIGDRTVENHLALIRMPSPGLSLIRHKLRYQLPDGRWAVSPIPDDGTMENMNPAVVISLCEDFVFRQARKLYLSENIVDGKINGRHVVTEKQGIWAWKWLPYKEQQRWMSKVLKMKSRETQTNQILTGHSSTVEIDQHQNSGALDIDLNNKTCLRTYLRLLHSLLGRDEYHGNDNVQANKVKSDGANQKKLEGLSSLIQLRDSVIGGDRRHMYTRLNAIEAGLVEEARTIYIRDHQLSTTKYRLDPLAEKRWSDRFDRMSYFDRAAFINKVNSGQIAKNGCDATVHESSPLIDSNLENLLVENILTMMRLPEPGLVLLRGTLVSKMSEGRWLMSSHSDPSDQEVLTSVNVLQLCEGYVRSLASNLFVSGGLTDGRDSSGRTRFLSEAQMTQWRGLTLAQQHEWMRKALEILSNEKEANAMALGARLSSARLPSVRARP